LEGLGLTVRETVDARKTRFGSQDLAGLMGEAREVVVAKGKHKTLSFQPQGEIDWDEVAAVALGRSGNLRAPTIRVGQRFLVGFSEAAYEAFLS